MAVSPPRGPRVSIAQRRDDRGVWDRGREYTSRSTESYHRHRDQTRSKSPDHRQHDGRRNWDALCDREAIRNRERVIRGGNDRVRTLEYGGYRGQKDYDDRSNRYRSRSPDRHIRHDRGSCLRGARSKSREHENRRRSPSRQKDKAMGHRNIHRDNHRSSSPLPQKTTNKMILNDNLISIAEDIPVVDEQAQMATLMGFGGFGTTKQKKVQGNNVGMIAKSKASQYRQYMNRPGGFNRALSPS